MAVIKQGILGGFQNKIGSVVGTSWKGIAVMKSKPISVANPRTASQIAQRDKMSNVVAYGQTILAEVIKPLWDRFAAQMSGFNDFVSTNIALFAAEEPSVPANLVISKGKMAATPIDSILADVSDDTLELHWLNDAGVGLKLASDVCYAVVRNSTLHETVVIPGPAIRSNLSIATNMPTGWVAGNVIHGYLAFKRADGTVVSDSSYKLGAVVA